MVLTQPIECGCLVAGKTDLSLFGLTGSWLAMQLRVTETKVKGMQRGA